MGAKILDLRPILAAMKNKQHPDWFRQTIRKPVVYHTDCLTKFKLVRDETKYAGGIAWICKNCGREVFTYEEYIKELDCFSVFMLFCHVGCNAKWMMQEIESYLEPMFEFPTAVRTGSLEWDIVRWAGLHPRLMFTAEDEV